MKRIKVHPHKLHFAFSLFIRGMIAVAIMSAVFTRNWTILFLGSIALILTFLPAIIEKNYKIDLPTELEVVTVLFIFTSIFMGEMHGYYTKYWWWDVVLHTSAGIVLGFIGFLIMFVLYDQGKIKARPITIAIFSFCFALAIGALWEIFEFSMDSFFGWNMQSTGLVDTMWDLIVDTGGALLTSALGYLYLRGGKHRIFQKLITRFINANPDLFTKT